ncbi:MAG: 2-oxo acid dehydrogenase subunit E2, partial [Bacteroidia bacterium]|nr:2-oxo acid dehydrogenase subunit E2 [Bacteroidia bacterium]
MSRVEFKMPKLGESITEAAIITWFKNPGDTIEEDEMLLEVATDKVDSEVPSTVSGIVEEILFEANTVIKIGEVIAIINSDGKSNGKSKTTKKKDKTQKQQAKTEKALKRTKQPASDLQNKNTFFSPLIVNIAKEQHISYEELARIPATGKDGRLRKSDLFQYIKEGRPFKLVQPGYHDATAFRLPQLNLDKGKGKIVEMDRMRKMIADHMVYSKHTSPHVTSYAEADLTELVKWRNAHKAAFSEAYNEKLTYTPLFVAAVSKAIENFPMINVSVDDDKIIVKEDINIGIATALPNGNLIVPVIRNANKKPLKDMAAEVNSLVEKARTNTLKADDIQGGTFTISNVGTFGS